MKAAMDAKLTSPDKYIVDQFSLRQTTRSTRHLESSILCICLICKTRPCPVLYIFDAQWPQVIWLGDVSIGYESLVGCQSRPSISVREARVGVETAAIVLLALEM